MIFHSYNGMTKVYLDEPETATRQEIKERLTQALVF
jgi:hypothetical protein